MTHRHGGLCNYRNRAGKTPVQLFHMKKESEK